MFKVNNKDTTTTPYNIKRFVKIFNGFKLLITLAKHSILHIWQGSEYTSELIFTLRKKYPYLKFFWSVFSRIWFQYGAILLSLRIQSEGGKMGTRKTPNMDTFHALSISTGIVVKVVDFRSLWYRYY